MPKEALTKGTVTRSPRRRDRHGSSGWRLRTSTSSCWRLEVCSAVVLLFVSCTLLVWSASRQSPTWDEVGHLPAGVAHWQTRQFHFYVVNPPLVRMTAALAPVLVGAKLPREMVPQRCTDRGEYALGEHLVRRDPERAFRLFCIARWSCVPFALLGGWVCFLWARELYGGFSGILALVLWCFSPNVIAHGQLCTPDCAAAALGAAACYVYWRWLKRPSWRAAASAGLALGVAELTKFTLLVFFVLWPAMWLLLRGVARAGTSLNQLAAESTAAGRWRRDFCQLALMFLCAIFVINVGYGFEGSFRQLKEYTFASELLSGSSRGGPQAPDSASPLFAAPHGPTAGSQQRARQTIATESGARRQKYGSRSARQLSASAAAAATTDCNRFVGTWLAVMPVPLPANYVAGVDLQRWDFERKMWSYLRGEWRFGGWWYYYLYATLIKEPLGSWILVLLAIGWRIFQRTSPTLWQEELVLVAPAVAIFLLVSSQTGFNHHLRYVLPAFPYVFVWISKLASNACLQHRKLTVVGLAALLWSISSSLRYVPHSLSYFNELVGGPTGGHHHLGNSNADWGQDLFYLKKWHDAHPDARPLHVAHDMPLVDPKLAGIEYVGRPPEYAPKAGWHAVSVNQIHDQSGKYDYFLKFQPVATAGYSIYIYHITAEQAARIKGTQRATTEIRTLDHHARHG